MSDVQISDLICRVSTTKDNLTINSLKEHPQYMVYGVTSFIVDATDTACLFNSRYQIPLFKVQVK